ncbi:hypothetical protein [Kitasatospora griseola]|uniref:hypothetical protein n=1 Tax=Kitasatospora griseola TaxID=2064 RepID=UPI0037F102B0
MPGTHETTAETETGQVLSAAQKAGPALVAAHRLLGRELGALAAEESRTGSSSKDRTATLRRKKLLLRDVSRHLADAVSTVALLAGLEACGVHGQYPQDAAGRPRTELAPLEGLDSDTYLEALARLSRAVEALRQVYLPTVKNPDLAHPEDRPAMAEAVTHLRTAYDVLAAWVDDDDDEDEDQAATLGRMMAELESICAPLPVPQVDLSDEDVIARVLADPRLAARTGRALRQQRQVPSAGAAT